MALLPARSGLLSGGASPFSHQDPGFIDPAVNKKAEVVRIYLPPDANTLLSVTDHPISLSLLRQGIRQGVRQPPSVAHHHDL